MKQMPSIAVTEAFCWIFSAQFERVVIDKVYIRSALVSNLKQQQQLAAPYKFRRGFWKLLAFHKGALNPCLGKKFQAIEYDSEGRLQEEHCFD